MNLQGKVEDVPGWSVPAGRARRSPRPAGVLTLDSSAFLQLTLARASPAYGHVADTILNCAMLNFVSSVMLPDSCTLWFTCAGRFRLGGMTPAIV